MRRPRHIYRLPLALMALAAAGCSGSIRLPLGYYLTPISDPPAQTASPVQVMVTATPAPPPTATPLPTSTPTSTLDPTSTLEPCQETEGQVIQAAFHSQITGEDVPYRIYLPPCYAQTERRYPYLILLHGLPADDSQWDNLGIDEAADFGFQRGSLPPLIIVMPNGGMIAGRNEFDEDYSYEYVILNELLPAIEKLYCTWNTRPTRAIGGLSRGGFWAFEIAFRHPEVFGTVGGHSAAIFEEHAGEDGWLVPDENNPLRLALTAPGIEDLRIYLDHGGSNDWVWADVDQFSRQLTRRGIEHIYVANPVGAHNEDYWSSHTGDYLAFYTNGWPKDPAELPSCHQPSPPPDG
jgi:enterochelin esterase-like enzyme